MTEGCQWTCSVVVRSGVHIRDDRFEIDTWDDGDDPYAKEAFSKSMRLGEVSLRGCPQVDMRAMF